MGIKWDDVDIMVTALGNQICLCKSKPVPGGAPDARFATDKSGDKTEKCVKAVMQYMLNCCEKENAYAKSFTIPGECRLELTDLKKDPSNLPLTLEQLQEMEGEPVFCVGKAEPQNAAWGIVCMRDSVPYVRTLQNKGKISNFFYLATYDSEWLAYHCKPKEMQT